MNEATQPTPERPMTLPTPERVRELIERLRGFAMDANQDGATPEGNDDIDTAAILADWLNLNAQINDSLPAFIAGAKACREYGWPASAAVLDDLAARNQT